jgi:hypothetical protein
LTRALEYWEATEQVVISSGDPQIAWPIEIAVDVNPDDNARFELGQDTEVELVRRGIPALLYKNIS